MIQTAVEALPLVTLVGPPNSGKTTLFNYLSGKNFKTVNYPGATVEYSISKFLTRFNINANLLDSPGIISLIPSSPDEQVSIDALYSHPNLGKPDIVVVTVDASQLSRHLLLDKQIIDSGFNVIIALTMTDLLARKGFRVSEAALSFELGCPVVSVDGRTGNGHSELIKEINEKIKRRFSFDKNKITRFSSSDNASLLSYYKEIERIENKVLLKTNGHSELKSNGINLDAANAQLVILSNPEVKENCHKIDET